MYICKKGDSNSKNNIDSFWRHQCQKNLSSMSAILSGKFLKILIFLGQVYIVWWGSLWFWNFANDPENVQIIWRISAKWLHYYIGVVWQMITVYHESWVVTLGILFPKTWQKNIFFSVGKKSFLGGMSKWLQLYIGGVRPNDYSIT